MGGAYVREEDTNPVVSASSYCRGVFIFGGG